MSILSLNFSTYQLYFILFCDLSAKCSKEIVTVCRSPDRDNNKTGSPGKVSIILGKETSVKCDPGKRRELENFQPLY